MSIFRSYFLKKYFMRKNWRGKSESLLKNSAIDGYWLRLLTMLFPGQVYIVRCPWHFADFCNIFEPNVSEDQKKVLLSGGRALALSHMANPALVVALRPQKV